MGSQGYLQRTDEEAEAEVKSLAQGYRVGKLRGQNPNPELVCRRVVQRSPKACHPASFTSYEPEDLNLLGGILAHSLPCPKGQQGKTDGLSNDFSFGSATLPGAGRLPRASTLPWPSPAEGESAVNLSGRGEPKAVT